MARSLLEDFDKQTASKPAAKAGKGGKAAGEKDPKAMIKLGAAIAVLLIALVYFGYQQGWIGGGNAPPAEPNIAPAEVQTPTTPPPAIGDEETGQIPEQPQTPTRVQGVN